LVKYTVQWLSGIFFSSFVEYLCSFRDFDISFVLWMDIRAEIREIVAQATKAFQWI
jgi:hypothetical protein